MWSHENIASFAPYVSKSSFRKTRRKDLPTYLPEVRLINGACFDMTEVLTHYLVSDIKS